MPRKKREPLLVTLDTETIGLDGDIKRIAIYYGQEVIYGYTFADIEPLLIDLYKRGYHPHVYIHNLEFDLRKLGNIFRKENVNWNTTKMVNGKYVILTCKHYTLHDSFKLLPMSLAKLSEDFGLEHGKMDLWEEVEKEYPGQYENHVDFLSRCDPDNEIYLKYLGYDVISLYELMEKLMEVTGFSLKEMITKISTASISKYLFRKGYKGEIFITEGERLTDYEMITKFKQWSSEKITRFGKSYREMEEKIREGYYGGRTEVFTPHCKKSGKISAYHYDVNSLYPTVMQDPKLAYPIGDPEYHTGQMATIIYGNWRRNHIGLGYIRARVYVPNQDIPPLPTNNGKLCFLCGYLEGTWTFNELEYAVKECRTKIIDIVEVIYFRNTFPVFKNFIDTFFKLKLEGKETGNEALTSFAKLILNTAYGYLALIRERDDVMNLDTEEKYRDKIIYKDEELGFIKIESYVISDSIQVQIAGYVTSYARLFLLKALRKQAKEGSVYYCDTDSIVCSTPLPNEWIDKAKLGYWDLEGELYEGFFIFPKVYYERKKGGKETIKFKGVTKQTQKSFDYDFYFSIFEKIKNGDTSKILIEKNRELLRGIQYSQSKGRDLNKLEYRDKYLNLGHIPKRNIDYRRNNSKPWFMNSFEEHRNFNLGIKIMGYAEYGNLFNTCS